MNENYQRDTQTDAFSDAVWKIFVVLLCLFIMPLLIIGFVGSSVIEERFPHRQRFIWTCMVFLSVAGLYVGYHFFWPLNRLGTPLMVLLIDVARGLHHSFQFNYERLLREIVPVWMMELVLSPLALIMFCVHNQTRAKSPQLFIRQRTQQRQVATQRARRAANRTLQRLIPEMLEKRKSGRAIVLGAPVEGTLREWIQNRFFTLPFAELIRHVVVLGASGSGKSETLLRIAIAAAKALGWQVIYIDAKGDYQAAAKFMLLMQDAKVNTIRMFPVDDYDGWRGSRDALLSKLLAIDNVAEVTSAGQHHYATMQENLVEMCINAPGGPPTSSKELLERLMVTNGKLYDLYNGYSEQQSYLQTILQRPLEALGAYGHYRAFFSKLHGKLDGSWAFDDCDAAYVLLDGLALPEITDGVGRFLLADFVNYATRKDWDKRVMFIFDEVGSLNLPLYSIFEKVRFRNVSVVVSSQDASGLARKPGGIGTWDEVRRVLGNSAIKIVHHCEDAYEVIKRAGTRQVPEENYRIEEGMNSGTGTMHFREDLKIEHNDVLQLQAGEAFVIGAGDYMRVRVAKREIEEAHWHELYKELERKSKAELPSRSRQFQGQPIVDSTLASSPPDTKSNGRSKSDKENTATTSSMDSSSMQKQQRLPLSAPASEVQKDSVRTVTQVQKPIESSSLQGIPDVDETLPFTLPKIHAVIPEQPGILPMWDNESKGEDLLP